MLKKNDFSITDFLNAKKEIPPILANNIDFILYLISNDLKYASYLSPNIVERYFSFYEDNITSTIVKQLTNNPSKLKFISQNENLFLLLSRNYEFICCMLSLDLDNIRYIDWHNLNHKTVSQVIELITKILETTDIEFNIMHFPERNLFFSNYNFIKYLIYRDFRWISVTMVNSKEELDLLVDLFFASVKETNYKFKLKDFLIDGKYLNSLLLTNKKMIHYFFDNNVPIIKYTDVTNMKSSKKTIEYIVDELEKRKGDYEFDNNDYLIDGKYPIILSNNYRFMRYVIDKNFNNIAFMNISLIDKRELKRIINYAFRMVYYIRGNNKKLTFDFEGYFKESEIYENSYFQECLESLNKN